VRTTLTLDDDVAALLQRRAAQTGLPFKQVVNEAIRHGLEPRTHPVDVVVPTFELRLRPGIDLDRARHLAAAMEDEEIARRLEEHR
jgi:Ribbon-helix-helix protein, copG family